MLRRSALALALLLSAPAASGAEGPSCVAAVEDAQLARYQGKLGAARAGFVQCARSSCPEAIRTDCARWLGEVEVSLPSVVLDARWSDGSDAVGVTITVDGAPVAEGARGRALVLDPGEHTVVVTHPGAPSAAVTVVVHEGEKNRPVKVSLLRSAPAAPVAPVRTTRPVPAASIALAGAALVGAGIGVGLWISGRSGLDDLRASCGHRCNGDDVDGQRQKLLAGDVLLAASVVALGAATWIFLRRPARTVGGAPFTYRF